MLLTHDLPISPPPESHLKLWINYSVCFNRNPTLRADTLAKKSWETNIGISGHIWRWIGIGSLYHFHLTNWHSLSSKVRCWLFVHRKLFWNWSLHPQLCWFKTFRFNLHWIWSNQPPTPSLLEAHTFHVFQMCVINSVILRNTLFLAS